MINTPQIKHNMNINTYQQKTVWLATTQLLRYHRSEQLRGWIKQSRAQCWRWIAGMLCNPNACVVDITGHSHQQNHWLWCNNDDCQWEFKCSWPCLEKGQHWIDGKIWGWPPILPTMLLRVGPSPELCFSFLSHSLPLFPHLSTIHPIEYIQHQSTIAMTIITASLL